MSATATREDVIWHDVECGAYGADLPLWESLAGERSARVLDLGCGTGRVALALAGAGHAVCGLDLDQALLDSLEERARAAAPAADAARARGELRTVRADARGFDLGERFDLVLAPMQLAQLLDRPGRAGMLAAVERHLAPGGRAALALTGETPAEWRPGDGASPPPPDVREIDGWVYSSLPVAIETSGEAIVLRRLRQVVSPAGELRDREHVVRLAKLSADELEREAGRAGLAARERHEVPATDDHVGSVVVVLEGSR
jgi:SAM-dependent methyltransferase